MGLVPSVHHSNTGSLTGDVKLAAKNLCVMQVAFLILRKHEAKGANIVCVAHTEVNIRSWQN